MTLNDLLLKAKERTNKQIESSEREYTRSDAISAMRISINKLLDEMNIDEVFVGYAKGNSIDVPLFMRINGRSECFMHIDMHCKKGKHTREKRSRYTGAKIGGMVAVDTFYIKDWKVWSVDPDKEISEIVESVISKRNEELSRKQEKDAAVLNAHKEDIDQIVALLTKINSLSWDEYKAIALEIERRANGRFGIR